MSIQNNIEEPQKLGTRTKVQTHLSPHELIDSWGDYAEPSRRRLDAEIAKDVQQKERE
jgi:hypothetical protein